MGLRERVVAAGVEELLFQLAVILWFCKEVTRMYE